MIRRKFIDTSLALAAGSVLAPGISCTPSPKVIETRTNWAGNYTYQAKNLHRPKTIEELQALVKELGQQKALGSAHCFNNIADSPLNQIATNLLSKVISIDETAKTVTVEGGIRYGNLAPELEKRGFALHNLASLPHISIVGACATATHGSGVTNGNLPSAVTALELVTANGEIVKLNRDDSDFYGAIVSLGALGIISKVTLDIQDTYTVRQDVFQNLPLQSIRENFEEIMSSGYSVSLFTDWQDELVSQVWIKRRLDQEVIDLGTDFYGATAATRDLHPIVTARAENCTAQLGVEGIWYERLPHFKWGFAPSSGEELQSEYFVPSENAVDALLALEGLKDQIFPELMISEIRTIAADQYWLSPCYKQDSVAFHFTWKQNWEGVRKILPLIEAELAPYGVVPHWGKVFTLSPMVLQSRYEKMNDFRQLVLQYDPEGKFRNTYLDLNIYKS